MNQLAEEMEVLTEELRGLRADLQEVSAALRKERFWRKAAAVLVLLGFASTLGFVSYLRQADCDRTNEARRRLPEAVAAGIGTAYDRFGPDDEVERRSLTAEVEDDVATLYPPRDCSWPA